MNGGELIAQTLIKHQVKFLFTLCGGHISPILVGCKRNGIQVVDVRNEANAVFAADSVARLTGVPGIAAVTAGPGVTNTITAIKNAQLAQSPVLIFGGATATILKNRGSLQDIDQLSIIRSTVKWATSVRVVRQLIPSIERALFEAQSGVPGPVFLECPVDLLYDEALVRSWYFKDLEKASNLSSKALKLYLTKHLKNQFRDSQSVPTQSPKPVVFPLPTTNQVSKVSQLLANAKKPVLVIGSQTMLLAQKAEHIAKAVQKLGIPTFLGGMARGLLGQENEIQFRHKRSMALKQADVILIAGFPFDFRLNYGQVLNRKAKVIAINRNQVELKKNRKPTLAICSDAGSFLIQLSQEFSAKNSEWEEWFQQLREVETKRETEIQTQASEKTEYINPLYLCQQLEKTVARDSILVADGGDFVATASYVLRPRNPLTWLDPGVFGTLGVGAGFALGAKLCSPDSEIWIIYGDGSVGYTLSEFDTFVRHQIPIIALVGTDASWAQIAREQSEVLKDDVGTVLRRTDYHKVVEGFGGKGLLLDKTEDIIPVFNKAKSLANEGFPVLINAQIGATQFRKGSISL